MKKLLLLFCSYVALNATAVDFNIIIEDNFNNALFSVTQDNDEHISAVGFTRVRRASHSEEVYTNAFDYLHDNNKVTGEQIRMIQINSEAHITKDINFKLHQFNRATSILSTSNNDYYIGGYTLDGQLILSRLQQNGTQVFQTLFGTKNYDRMHQLVQLRDGGVLAVGSSITSRSFNDPMFSGGLGLNDIYLTRFSREGKLLWTKKYGTSDDDNGISAVEANDGSIMVIASTAKGKNKNIILLRISEEGDKIWMKKYKREGVYEAHSIIKLKNNTFLANISMKKDTKQLSRLVIFDIQKNILRDVELISDEGFILNDIKEHANGDFSAAAQMQKNGTIDAVALHFNSRLEILWQKIFTDDNYNTFNALSILRSGDLVFVGTHPKHQNEVSNMWIVKLDIDGEVVMLNANYASLYKSLQKEFKHEMLNHGLKISPSLRIHFSSNALKFKQGVFTLTSYQKEFLKNFSPRLMKVLRPYKNIIHSLNVDGHSSKEWNTNSTIDTRYLNNSKLSSKRAHSVHEFVYLHVEENDKKWLRKISQADANSYKKQLKEKSLNRDAREVSFEIELKKDVKKN